MINRDFKKVLDECIDRMNSGETPDECIKHYPEYAEKLEPYLRTVSVFQSRSAFVPSASAREKGREKLCQAITEHRRKEQVSEEKRSIFQRLFGRPRVLAPVAAALAIIIIGYSLRDIFVPVAIPLAQAGTLEVRVTDAPKYDVSAVNITVANIEISKSETETSWIGIVEENKSFDLLKLRGVEEVLGSKKIDTGHYTQIRMDVKYVSVTVDGIPQNAKLPGEKLKLVGSFTVEDGKTTTLTLDIDADKSIVITGKDTVIFKPVVKIIVTNE